MHTQSSHAPTKKECVQKKAGEKVLRMQHEANMLISELPVNAMSSSAALTSTGCRGGSDATRLAVGVGPIDIKRRNPGVGGVWSNQHRRREWCITASRQQPESL